VQDALEGTNGNGSVHYKVGTIFVQTQELTDEFRDQRFAIQQSWPSAPLAPPSRSQLIVQKTKRAE
jgi:hypothetical protein